MTLETEKATNEAQIRALMEDWADAVRSKDIDRLLSHYALDMVAFDAWGPLRVDLPTMRTHWEQCFAGHDGPVGLEHHEVQITAGDDVAFVHCLICMHGKLRDGNEHTFWGRGTICFKKIDGRWLVTHEHASAPFDPMSGEACMNLEP